MGKGDDAKWSSALTAASRVAPAEEWRASIARAVREATSAEFTQVITCPPGDWGQHFQTTTYPDDHASLARVAHGFLTRIQASGEGFSYAIRRHGRVYAPLDVAQHRPLAEEMREALLAPAGLRGWVVTSILDDAGALIGVIAFGSKRSSAALLEEAAGPLHQLSTVTGTTLGGAIRLAAGCFAGPGAVPPPVPGGKAQARAAALVALTPREHELAALVAEGLRNANIGARLGISEATVAVHLKRIYGKLGISSRVDLAMLSRA